jgi:hypothetical protein
MAEEELSVTRFLRDTTKPLVYIDQFTMGDILAEKLVEAKNINVNLKGIVRTIVTGRMEIGRAHV